MVGSNCAAGISASCTIVKPDPRSSDLDSKLFPQESKVQLDRCRLHFVIKLVQYGYPYGPVAKRKHLCQLLGRLNISAAGDNTPERIA